MQLPQDDEKLVAFVRRYRPVPPPAAINLEQQLMSLVEKNALNCQKKTKLRCLVPAACAAGLLLAWGGYNWFASQQQPQFAASPQEEELETILVESWQGTVGEPTNAFQPVSAEADWLALADFQNKSSVNSVSRP
jgi:hypothetical protein